MQYARIVYNLRVRGKLVLERIALIGHVHFFGQLLMQLTLFFNDEGDFADLCHPLIESFPSRSEQGPLIV